MYWPLLWFKERLYKREASTITVGKKENAYCRVQLANFKQLQIAWEELVGLEPGQEKGMKKLSVEEMTKVIHPKYSKHWPSTVAHTMNHGLNRGLLFSLSKFFRWKYILNQLENSGLRSRFLLYVFDILVLYDLQANQTIFCLLKWLWWAGESPVEEWI